MNHERLKHIIRSANNIINRVESPDFKPDKGAMEERMAELKSNTEVPLMTAEQIRMMTGEAPAQPQYQQTQYQQPNVSHLPVDQQKLVLDQQYNQMFNQQYGHMLQNQQAPNPQPINIHLNPDAVKKSRLPGFIQEAMINQPIQQLNPANYIGGKSFDLSDVADIVQEHQTTPQYQQQYQQPVQSIGNVTEDIIRTIVREEVMEMMGRYFGNNINEDLEKKLIQKLIKEGKIKTVPKKK